MGNASACPQTHQFLAQQLIRSMAKLVVHESEQLCLSICYVHSLVSALELPNARRDRIRSLRPCRHWLRLQNLTSLVTSSLWGLAPSFGNDLGCWFSLLVDRSNPCRFVSFTYCNQPWSSRERSPRSCLLGSHLRTHKRMNLTWDSLSGPLLSYPAPSSCLGGR